MTHVSHESGERLIRIVPEHWIKYVFPVFVYILLLTISGLLFLLAGVTAHHNMWLSHAAFIAALLLFLVNHHWFFLVLLSESTAHIVVTNKRVVWMRDSMLFHEEILEYAFEKMKTVQAHKSGILQTIFRYGSLKFESGPVIRLVPHPGSVAKDIEQAMGLR